jgi:hypothetical protein
MKNYLSLLSASIILILFVYNCKNNPAENSVEMKDSSIKIFDGVLFYDGYAETVNEPVPEGVIRVQNSRYVTKIPIGFINGLKQKLEMEVIVKAACDNYDRIGSVYLSMINKDEPYIKSKIVHQIEIARFITPFMVKINRRKKCRTNMK